jgi:hypothetical protein
MRMCFDGTAAANGPISQLPDSTQMNMEQHWNNNGGRT